MNNLIYIFLQALTILMLAPLVNGLIRKMKAFIQKRQGASIFQMYYDLYKLVRKGSVVSEVSSWIFKATPYIFFASALVAAMLVPVSTIILPKHIPGDFIVLVSVLGLGRFFMMLAALDTASTFGGMGSSREAMVSTLIEPTILVSLFTIGLISQSTSLSQIMLTVQGAGFPLAHPVYIMVFLALLIVIIAESARIPIDDPSTHLELTMIHEAMILEYSGRHLALMEYGAAIKQLVFMTLLVNVLVPHDQIIAFTGFLALFLSLLIYFFKILILTGIIALIEINTVKFRLFSIPNMAAFAFILSFLGILQYFILGGSNV